MQLELFEHSTLGLLDGQGIKPFNLTSLLRRSSSCSLVGLILAVQSTGAILLWGQIGKKYKY